MAWRCRRIGVLSTPEVAEVDLLPGDDFVILASDGLFEFVSAHEAVQMVAAAETPAQGCQDVSALNSRIPSAEVGAPLHGCSSRRSNLTTHLQCALQIVEEAYNRWRVERDAHIDDITAIVMKLKHNC